MPDFNVHFRSVNVEQIMSRIRARIREKRGADDTEEQLRELAAGAGEVPGIRAVSAPTCSTQFRKAQPAYEPPELPEFRVQTPTLFESHRRAIPGCASCCCRS